MTFGKLGDTFRGETRADMQRQVRTLGAEIAAALALKTEAERYRCLDAIQAASSHNQRMIISEITMRLLAAHPPGRDAVMRVVSEGE